jgi:hypothetical protein
MRRIIGTKSGPKFADFTTVYICSRL